MKISLINGSPKRGKSTSGYVMGLLKPMLDGNDVKEYTVKDGNVKEAEKKDIFDCDALVLFFPLYVDSVPSHLLKLMMEAETALRENPRKIHVYCFSINGFYEGNQNRYAIQTVKNWCERAGLIFGQGFGCGAGEMLPQVAYVPLGHGPNKNLGLALNELAENIKSGKTAETVYFSPNWPKFLWKIQASTSIWHPRAKANGVSRRAMWNKAQ